MSTTAEKSPGLRSIDRLCEEGGGAMLETLREDPRLIDAFIDQAWDDVELRRHYLEKTVLAHLVRGVVAGTLIPGETFRVRD